MLDPNVFNNQKELLKITKEHSSLDQIVKLGKNIFYVKNNSG